MWTAGQASGRKSEFEVSRALTACMFSDRREGPFNSLVDWVAFNSHLSSETIRKVVKDPRRYPVRHEWLTARGQNSLTRETIAASLIQWHVRLHPPQNLATNQELSVTLAALLAVMYGAGISFWSAPEAVPYLWQAMDGTTVDAGPKFLSGVADQFYVMVLFAREPSKLNVQCKLVQPVHGNDN